VYANRVAVYKIKTPDGIWVVETVRQVVDASMRGMGMTPAHLRSEKANPLDSLGNGDKVMFRMEKHRKIGGTDTNIYIPYADKPDKEAEFLGTFVPFHPLPKAPAKPTDNIKAMCNSGRLTPEQTKQFCTEGN